MSTIKKIRKQNQEGQQFNNPDNLMNNRNYRKGTLTDPSDPKGAQQHQEQPNAPVHKSPTVDSNVTVSDARNNPVPVVGSNATIDGPAYIHTSPGPIGHTMSGTPVRQEVLVTQATRIPVWLTDPAGHVPCDATTDAQIKSTLENVCSEMQTFIAAGHVVKPLMIIEPKTQSYIMSVFRSRLIYPYMDPYRSIDPTAIFGLDANGRDGAFWTLLRLLFPPTSKDTRQDSERRNGFYGLVKAYDFMAPGPDPTRGCSLFHDTIFLWYRTTDSTHDE